MVADGIVIVQKEAVLPDGWQFAGGDRRSTSGYFTPKR